MPADLSVTNGVAEMMYVGEKPWHGRGKYLAEPATSEEAIAAANMDWDVELRPLYYNYHGEKRDSNRRSVVRMDTGTELSVVSSAYTPLQNREAFSFFDGVVANGEAVYETAGTIFGGRRVWILARLPGDLKVSEQDILHKYILLANSHDGSTSIVMRPTTIRVVCSNTLSMALGQSGKEWKTYHTGDVMSRIVEAREALELQDAHFELMMRGIERMAETPMESDHEPFFRELFQIKAADPYVSAFRVKEIETLFETGRGNEGRSRWDMMNGVSEWVDHHRGGEEGRLESSWFGYGSKLKARAFELLSV